MEGVCMAMLKGSDPVGRQQDAPVPPMTWQTSPACNRAIEVL